MMGRRKGPTLARQLRARGCMQQVVDGPATVEAGQPAEATRWSSPAAPFPGGRARWRTLNAGWLVRHSHHAAGYASRLAHDVGYAHGRPQAQGCQVMDRYTPGPRRAVWTTQRHTQIPANPHLRHASSGICLFASVSSDPDAWTVRMPPSGRHALAHIPRALFTHSTHYLLNHQARPSVDHRCMPSCCGPIPAVQKERSKRCGVRTRSRGRFSVNAASLSTLLRLLAGEQDLYCSQRQLR